MNRRFVQFMVALTLCLFGLYYLVAGVLVREMDVTPFGLQLSPLFVALLCLGVIGVGVRLVWHAVHEELSVTSD